MCQILMHAHKTNTLAMNGELRSNLDIPRINETIRFKIFSSNPKKV